MQINNKTVECMADRACLYITEKETEKIAEDINSLLRYFDKLNEIDTENVAPDVYPLTDKNILRDDVVEKSLCIHDVLKNAPDTDNRFFRVPRIIDEQ